MISRDAQGTTARHLQQTSEKAASRGTVAMLAEHRVEQLTIPIDRAVEVAPAAGDLHVRLVQIPRPPGATTAARPKIGADQRRAPRLRRKRLHADRTLSSDRATQRRTTVAVRPRSRATAAIVLPLVRQSSTTSALYSSVNARRARRPVDSIQTSFQGYTPYLGCPSNRSKSRNEDDGAVQFSIAIS